MTKVIPRRNEAAGRGRWKWLFRTIVSEQAADKLFWHAEFRRSLRAAHRRTLRSSIETASGERQIVRGKGVRTALLSLRLSAGFRGCRRGGGPCLLGQCACVKQVADRAGQHLRSKGFLQET